MAINWILALKAVPWTDLVQAAPHIVKGARKLFTSVRGDAGVSADTDSTAVSGQARTGVVPRLTALESELATLRAEQCASAELIRALAEQNAKVIEAIEILRARARILFAASFAFAAALVAIAVWIATR